jgi:serine phosphatase RsbU (regulator of sigma subunit)
VSTRDEASVPIATVTRQTRADSGVAAQRETATAVATTRHRPLSWVSVLVLVSGLAVTAVFSWLAYTVNNRNEQHLLNLATKQAGAVLQAAIPTIQTSLASSAAVAAASDGDPNRFRGYMTTFVGGRPHPFLSASLWRLSGGAPKMIASVGVPPELAAAPARLTAFLTHAPSTPQFTVTGILSGKDPRLAYAYTPDGPNPAYAVYAESWLPRHHFATVKPGSAFSNLRFALYLGPAPQTAELLEANVRHLPVSGRTAMVTIPFGAKSLTLVASPSSELGGALAARLWWLIAITGGLLAIAAALAADRLVRRRVAAEQLSDEVQALLSEQRGIAETLQRAMLPRNLPVVPGIEIAARYLPGTSGVEVGGDWYDTIELGPDRVFFVVGDVSGRGVDAASVMASLRFAIRGFATEGYSPESVLAAVSRLLNVGADHHFATVLCGVADVQRHEVTIANAGHPPALLVSRGAGRFLSASPGLPVGITDDVAYAPVTFAVPRGATLLAYTDGLVERRGESIDVGFQRLSDAAAGCSGSLEELVDSVISELAHGRVDDDTAVLAIRWSS